MSDSVCDVLVNVLVVRARECSDGVEMLGEAIWPVHNCCQMV